MRWRMAIPKSGSWLAFYLYCFLIGFVTASLRAPFWVIMVLFAGLIIVHTLALHDSRSEKNNRQ